MAILHFNVTYSATEKEAYFKGYPPIPDLSNRGSSVAIFTKMHLHF